MSVRSGYEAADEHRPSRGRYVILALAFGVFGGWTACTPFDSAAGLMGHIEADSPRMAVRHTEGGIVREVLVREGEAVTEGRALIRLESMQARVHADMLRKQLDAALAREARLIAELNGRPDIQFGFELLNRIAILETATILDDEQRQFAERRQFMDSQLKMAETRLEQTRQEIAERVRLQSALAAQLDAVTDELASLKPLAKKNARIRSQYLASEQEWTRLKGELDEGAFDLDRLEKQEDEALVRKQALNRDFRTQVAEELAEARNRLSDVREKLAAASQVLGRLEIRSPIAGIVRNLRVAGAGGVIEAGEIIADLVPTGRKALISAQVSSRKVDGVAAGQRAVIRFSWPPRTPPVFGRVESVSEDALDNQAAEKPYRLARILVDLDAVPRKMAARLSRGVPADVVIATRERTMLKYPLGMLAGAMAQGIRRDDRAL